MQIKNAERFTGFADIYESARPSVPEYPVRVLSRYLGRKPQTVADIGCGTGLSTLVWRGFCQKAIGIEPSEDMLGVARKKSRDGLEFIHGTGEHTGLCDNSVDIAVCSQSFHWMEPKATLKEINRILKNGGVFATIDCDWPPVTELGAEIAYMRLYKKVKTIEAENPDIKDTFTRYPKEKHLKNMTESGYFAYTRELLFANSEPCNAERFKNIIMSQGSLQTILKKHPELIKKDLEDFKSEIDAIYGDKEFETEFCYRMRVGIKE